MAWEGGSVSGDAMMEFDKRASSSYSLHFSYYIKEYMVINRKVLQTLHPKTNP